MVERVFTEQQVRSQQAFDMLDDIFNMIGGPEEGPRTFSCDREPDDLGRKDIKTAVTLERKDDLIIAEIWTIKVAGGQVVEQWSDIHHFSPDRGLVFFQRIFNGKSAIAAGKGDDDYKPCLFEQAGGSEALVIAQYINSKLQQHSGRST